MRKIKANDIPIDTFYCTGCPYLKYKRINYGYTGRKIPQEYCDEWFDVYDQDNNKVAIEGESK